MTNAILTIISSIIGWIIGYYVSIWIGNRIEKYQQGKKNERSFYK